MSPSRIKNPVLPFFLRDQTGLPRGKCKFVGLGFREEWMERRVNHGIYSTATQRGIAGGQLLTQAGFGFSCCYSVSCSSLLLSLTFRCCECVLNQKRNQTTTTADRIHSRDPAYQRIPPDITCPREPLRFQDRMLLSGRKAVLHP